MIDIDPQTLSSPEAYRAFMKSLKKAARKMGWAPQKAKLEEWHLKEGDLFNPYPVPVDNDTIDGCVTLQDGTPVYFTNLAHMAAFIERFMK